MSWAAAWFPALWGRKCQGPAGCTGWLQHLLKGGRSWAPVLCPCCLGKATGWGLSWDRGCTSYSVHATCLPLTTPACWAVEEALIMPTAGPGSASWLLMVLTCVWDLPIAGLPSSRGARSLEAPLQEGSVAHETQFCAHVLPRAARSQ